MFDKVKFGATAILFRKNGKRTNADVFRHIYEKDLWNETPGGGMKFCSGKGSDEEYALPYAALIREFMTKNQIRSVVDFGCGDFRVASQFAFHCEKYIGIDCVEELVKYNAQTYGNDKVRFMCLDIVKDELPDGELCLIRQVLQHLSNADIEYVLHQCSKYSYVIVTEHLLNELRQKPNMDKVRGLHTRLFFGSGVYLDKEPFRYMTEKLLEIPYDEKSHLEVHLIKNSR